MSDTNPQTHALCPSCGAESQQGSSFCVSCGRPLEQSSVPSEEPAEQVIASTSSTAGSASSTASPPPSPASPPPPPASPPPPPGSIPPSPPVGAGPLPAGPSNRTNATAIAALVFAILFWPVGIILGHIARRSIRRTGEKGGGLAIAALIVGYVWGGITVLLVVLAVFSNANQGFNNLNTLQNAVTKQVNQKLHDPSSSLYSPGTSVTSTLCVHRGGTQYSCLVKGSNGRSVTIPITVSSDGSRWVSNQ